MAETLTFCKIAPRLAPFRFSRGEALHLAYSGKKGRQFDTVADVKVALAQEEQAALALFHPRVLPLDLEQLFAITETMTSAESNKLGLRYLSDLQDHCRAVGFATLAELQLSKGETKPLIAFNLTVGESDLKPAPQFLPCNFRTTETAKAQRNFFGRAYEQLTGHIIIVAPGALPLGIFSLAHFIAHEVACIKLIEQAVRVGLKGADISRETEMFYTYAYSYNFALALIGYVKQFLPVEKMNNDQRRDLSNIIHNLQENFKLAMTNFDRLANEEKRRFLITTFNGSKMDFGQPFGVELMNLGTTVFSRSFRPGRS